MYKLTIFLFCFGAFVSASPFEEESGQNKCESDNSECLCNVFNVMLERIAKGNGREYGIDHAIDPYDLGEHNFNVELIPEGLRMHMTSGLLTGLGDCHYSNCSTNFETGHGTMDIVCEHLKVKGQYDVAGDIVNAKDGNVELEIDELTINVKTGISTYCGKDGKRYAKFDKSFNDFSLGNLKFNIDQLRTEFGDMSGQLNEFIAKYWKHLKKSIFVTSILNGALKVYNDQCDIVFSHVSTDKYLKNPETLGQCEKN